jgi:hypothetical protein
MSTAGQGAVALLAATLLAAVAVPAARHAVRPQCLYRAGGALPSATCTPGTTNPAVRQATIHRTICMLGWTATVRPPSSVTGPQKLASMRQYGVDPARVADDEYDHLLPLELGGGVDDTRNLWPEPHHVRTGGGADVGSYTKDATENRLHRLVCAVPPGMTLAAARAVMRRDWRLAR